MINVEVHDFWNNVLWKEETKVEMFGHKAQNQTSDTSCQHSGGGVMI